jgi:predicted transcriptional regulator
MSIRFDVLILINSGVTDRNEIMARLGINIRSVSNCVRFLVKEGWVEYSRESISVVGGDSFRITQVGIDKIKSSTVDDSRKSPKRKIPDYEVMRSHLGVGGDVTRSELINLWNELTDYYLPYEGDKEFTGSSGLSSR